MYRCYALVILLLALSRAHAEISCEPLWEEDFTGPLDQTTWNVIEGDGCAEGICGWGNNEVQHYSSQAVQVVDGALSITVAEKDGRITSGKLVSDGLFSQQYGRFAARIKLPRGRGGGRVLHRVSPVGQHAAGAVVTGDVEGRHHPRDVTIRIVLGDEA